jgi:hypothetical protein
MHATSRPVGPWLFAGVIAVAATVVIGWGHDNAYVGPYLALAVLASLAGWWRHRNAALAIYVGGIVGSTIVALGAGAVGVEPGADPAMRSSYYAMLVVLAGAVAAVLGLVVVPGGYLVGHLVRRLTPATRVER